MKIRLEQDSSLADIEVVIKYAKPCAEVNKLTALFKSATTNIKCASDGGERLVAASDIFYFESVDKRTFVYMERSVYRTDAPLYRLCEELEPLGFVQINKACVLNINMLVSIKRLPGSRMEATLRNGERLYVTRRYLDGIKRELKRGARE